MRSSITSSSAETMRLGHALGEALIRRGPKAKGATIIALQGELGAGKTTFTKGLHKGLGSRALVASPTFIIMRRARLKGDFKNVFHVDAYRLKDEHALRELGLQEIMEDPHNIVVIEWPERAGTLIPRDAIRIAFAHGASEHERSLKIQGISL